MTNIHHAEMTILVRREKELERELEQLREDFATWKERVELAKQAGRDELADKALERIASLRGDGRRIKRELEEIVEKKKELRFESKRPTGEENRRAQALLNSFKKSGIVDPDEAQLREELDELDGADDAALKALKAKAGIEDDTERSGEDETSDAAPASRSAEPGDEDAEPGDEDADAIDDELEALRQRMDDGDDGDVDIDELERMFDED